MVGTKLKLFNCHNTVGIDLVAMCVNDVLTAGAEPLFFWIIWRLVVESRAANSGGCRYKPRVSTGWVCLTGRRQKCLVFTSWVSDLAGFCVGIVEKSQMLDGSQVQVGDVAIGLASQSPQQWLCLVRKIVDSGFN